MRRWKWSIDYEKGKYRQSSQVESVNINMKINVIKNDLSF